MVKSEFDLFKKIIDDPDADVREEIGKLLSQWKFTEHVDEDCKDDMKKHEGYLEGVISEIEKRDLIATLLIYDEKSKNKMIIGCLDDNLISDFFIILLQQSNSFFETIFSKISKITSRIQ